jgi:hypothetical protein
MSLPTGSIVSSQCSRKQASTAVAFSHDSVPTVAGTGGGERPAADRSRTLSHKDDLPSSIIPCSVLFGVAVPVHLTHSRRHGEVPALVVRVRSTRVGRVRRIIGIHEHELAPLG